MINLDDIRQPARDEAQAVVDALVRAGYLIDSPTRALALLYAAAAVMKACEVSLSVAGGEFLAAYEDAEVSPPDEAA